MTFSEIIETHLRLTKVSPITAARRAGLNRDAIRSVLRGRSPSVDRAQQICSALGLEFYVGPPREPASTRGAEQTTEYSAGTKDQIVEELRGVLDRITGTLDKDYVEVPVYSEEITGLSQSLNRATECRFPYHRNWLERYGVDKESCFMVRVRGWSMAPTLPDKCFVLVNGAATELRDNAVLLVRHQNRVMVRRAEVDDRGSWMLSGDADPSLKLQRKPDDLVFGEIVWMAHHVRIRMQPVSIAAPAAASPHINPNSFPPLPSPHIHHPR